MVFTFLIAFISVSLFNWPSYSEKCSRKFHVEIGKIILSQESEKNGAEFLGRLNVQSFEDCFSACCNDKRCSVGVFTPKRGKECYLFDCHSNNVCNFTSHVDYTVFIQHPQVLPPHRIRKIVESPNLGVLRGRCGSKTICLDEHAICDSGSCICQAGWIEKKGSCVHSVCQKPDLQFQCDDNAACIAIYDVCNGIAECRDGSDELGCENGSIGSGQKMASLSYNKSRDFSSENQLAQLRDRLVHRLYHDTSVDKTDVRDAKLYPFIVDTTELDSDDSSDRQSDAAVKLQHHLSSLRPQSSDLDLSSSWNLYSPGDLSSSTSGEVKSTFAPFLLHLKHSRRLKDLIDGGSNFQGVRIPRQKLLGNLVSRYPLHQPPISEAFSDNDLSRREVFANEDGLLSLPEMRVRRQFGPVTFSPTKELETTPWNRVKNVFPESVRYPVSQASELGMKSEHRRRLFSHPFVSRKYRTHRRTSVDSIIDEIPSKSLREGEKSTLSSMPVAEQSRVEWHVAAILLAVGLGVISCLFGLLVGRCRRSVGSGGFTKTGPRSKAVAASRLRRRIGTAHRQMAGNDVETNGLLNGLTL